MPSVLITGFNRPNLLRKTIQKVVEAEGLSNLYIHLDGPRENHPNDVSLVSMCQKLVQDLAQKITIRHYFQEHNLGCEKGMKFAIDWFFQQEESGVIIEDDILIHPQALQIAELALTRYRHNPIVGQINLYNPIAKNVVNRELRSYFLDYPMIWGWACWRNRWELNSNQPSTKLDLTFAKLKMQNKIGLVAAKYWLKKITNYSEKSNTWDIPWILTCWSHQLICLSFSQSLTTNIGYGSDATHTTNFNNSRLAPISTSTFDLSKVQFSKKVLVRKRMNKIVSNHVWDMSVRKIISNKVKRIIRTNLHRSSLRYLEL